MAACCLAGAGASLTLPPFGVVPLIALLSWPALIIANAATTRRAALAGGLTGFGWFLASVWWISFSLVTGDTNYWPLLPLPLIGIPLILASFWVPAAALAHRLGRSTGARLGWLLLFLTLLQEMQLLPNRRRRTMLRRPHRTRRPSPDSFVGPQRLPQASLVQFKIRPIAICRSRHNHCPLKSQSSSFAFHHHQRNKTHRP